MKAVLVAAVVSLVPMTARADALLEYGAHGSPRPASQLAESGCEVAVDVRGGFAIVEVRQSIVNTGAVALAAGYEFGIPADATLVGASLREGSGPERTALGVPEGYATTLARPGDVVGVDPLVVEAIDLDAQGHLRYRATLQPIDVGHTVVLTTRWASPVAVDGGALQLELPGRASDGQLPACRGTLHAAAGPGATVAHARAGTTTTAGSALTFALDDAAVPIAVELAFARPEPLVWTQRDELGAGWASELVTVVTPPARATSPVAHRAMFVIDVSRSMTMIGSAAIGKIVDAVAAAQPPGTQLDAILYDRTATRVLGTWQPADRAVAAIRDAVASHASANGSDLAGALRVAHAALADGTREETSLIVITDGVLGALPDTALVDALAESPSAVDVHAIVIDPAGTKAPGRGLLERATASNAGSYIEVGLDQLDGALASVDAWLRPSWVDLALTGLPAHASWSTSALRAGNGGSIAFVTHGAAPTLALTARRDAVVHVAAVSAGPLPPGGALAASTLRMQLDDVFGGAALHAQLSAAHPVADAQHALVVVSDAGKLARDRRALLVGGGPYTRVVALADPPWDTPRARTQAAAPSAIDRLTLERLFRDQLQPAAYVCYERALGAAPKLAGTAHFELHLGRGEVTRAEVSGLGDAAFAACLVDAAYRMTPPVPDLALNSDDQTLVHYPLTFGLADRHPVVVLGDADSSSPIDIDAIEGGVPKPVSVDDKTPLGSLRPR